MECMRPLCMRGRVITEAQRQMPVLQGAGASIYLQGFAPALRQVIEAKIARIDLKLMEKNLTETADRDIIIK